MRKALIHAVVTGSLCLAPVVMADDMAKASVEKAVEAGFSELERQIIEKYFGKQQEPDEDKGKSAKKDKTKKGLPPGLAKRDELPPGLAMQLQKNGTLPPGLAKRDLPSDLNKRLPPVPDGYERRIIEDAAIVLVHKATRKIVDVISDVIIGEGNGKKDN